MAPASEGLDATSNQWLEDFEKLSLEDQEAHVAALGPEDGPQLLAIAEHAQDDRSGALAVERLVDLRITMAIEPLCALLGRVEQDSERRESLLLSLSSLGTAVIEPLLHLREGLSEPWRRDDVVLALSEDAHLPKDERIFAALCEYLPRSPDLGAELLAEYGDARAIPLIERAIDNFWPVFDSVLSERELSGLVVAHRRLGGTLPDSLQGRVHSWLETWRNPARPPTPVQRAGPKLGRNEACHCGSGKKYKKCCLGTQAL